MANVSWETSRQTAAILYLPNGCYAVFENRARNFRTGAEPSARFLIYLSLGIAHDDESRPINRIRELWVVKEFQFCTLQGSGRAKLRSALFVCLAGTMESQHKLRRTGGLHLPLADHRCRSSGDKKRPR